MRYVPFILIFLAAAAQGQTDYRRVMDSLNVISKADHKRMMESLGIDSIRRGANGSDPKAPNAANYDEAKANPYPILPALLTFNNGSAVKTTAEWKKRKVELFELFDREIYGRVPKKTPGVKWTEVSSKDTLLGSIKVNWVRLKGHVDNSAFPQINVDIELSLVLPAGIKNKVPVVLDMIFVFPPGFRFPNDTTKNTGPPPTPEWQLNCLKRGWGFALLVPVSIQPDNGAGLTQGIIGLVNKGKPRKPDDWGALRAWAWGASRVMDYFEKHPLVDASHVAVSGHSRYGKATLVTMAYDPRFAAGYVSSSGEGGAKLHRRNYGELVENLAGLGAYHWVAGNFIKYAGPLNWNDLPIDSHELIALCAPRPLFIGVGENGDQWVDARGMFMATVAAGPAYKITGTSGLNTDSFPPVNTGLLEGTLAYRQHSGGHTPAPNWPYFLDFAAKHFQWTLAGRYKDYFPIGVAVSPRSLLTDEAQLIRTQFNSISAENAMKMGPIHPEENRYYWKDADSIVAFATRNGMKLRGHTLCWHNQAPQWMFKDSAGNDVSKEVLLARLKEHITTVVNRYKGKIYAWDVVNEAISDKPDEYLRPSAWYRICGEEYIAKAFQYAHDADPEAILFYNDYNETDPIKREKIYKLISSLKAAGVPVHGLGLQGHWNIYNPSPARLDSAIQRYTSLGVTLQITELDISVYPSDSLAWKRSSDTTSLFSPEREDLQLKKYDEVFELFRKYRKHISTVTFWNISDRRSWLDNFPIRGRKNYPLLFDKDLVPKRAYAEVVGFKDDKSVKLKTKSGVTRGVSP